jgi:hypothetical protein
MMTQQANTADRKARALLRLIRTLAPETNVRKYGYWYE